MPKRILERAFSWAFPHDRPLTEEERRLVLRVTAIVAIPLAFICMFALLIGGWVAWHYTHNAIESNQQAIVEARQATRDVRNFALDLNSDRSERERQAAWSIYDQCVENENQDQVTADLLRKFRKLIQQAARQAPQPSPARSATLDAIQTWLDAREPPGESDCDIPPFPRPGR